MKKSLIIIFTSMLTLNSFVAHAASFGSSKFNVFCVLPTPTQNFTETYEGVSYVATNGSDSKNNLPTVYFVDKDDQQVYLEGYYCKFTSVKGNAK